MQIFTEQHYSLSPKVETTQMLPQVWGNDQNLRKSSGNSGSKVEALTPNHSVL